jgi:hypothetical protein
MIGQDDCIHLKPFDSDALSSIGLKLSEPTQRCILIMGSNGFLKFAVLSGYNRM